MTRCKTTRTEGRPDHGDDAILAAVEARWVKAAEGIRECNPDLRIEQIESNARRAIELLVFLLVGRARGAIPASMLPRFGQDFSELERSVEDHFGRELLWVEPADRSETAGGGLPDGAVDCSSLSRSLAAAAESGFVHNISDAPVEILGSAHQHLLGKRLRRASKGKYRAETSAARKKAAGIFYTPDYVIRYIVSKVLGDGFENGRLIDPAAGCGWFLLAAYRFLREKGGQSNRADAADSAPRQIHGVDLDPGAVLAARRSLWLEIMDGERRGGGREIAALLAKNVRCGNALTGPTLADDTGRFSAVIGNPPYRRELNGKALFDKIAATEFGRRWRAPRMDLWYYFVHRGLELLEPGGRLSFIVGSYWTSGTGAQKLIEDLRASAQVDEIFSLDRLPVFPGVSGRHMILTLTKKECDSATLVKTPRPKGAEPAELFLSGRAPLIVSHKTPGQLFRDGRIDLEPPCDELLGRLARHPRLGALGQVRQGIAENPARVTRKAVSTHGKAWEVGEGVFVLSHEELSRLDLSEPERRLIRPYHQLRDLGRYYLADEPSASLIYSTPQTCPELAPFPSLREHLARFRPIMESRRETRRGTRRWWQLHWPREERLWESPKLIALQMARRPSFVAAPRPVYVPFSANVFVPDTDAKEDLDYLAALLNSRLVWFWYRHHAKRRGIGLDLGGRVLRQTPIRRIDFSDSADAARHDRAVELAGRLTFLTGKLRLANRQRKAELEDEFSCADRQLDALVFDLYGLEEDEIATVVDIGIPAG